jgi:hypothetical protein
MRTARRLVPGGSLVTSLERASPAYQRGRARLESFVHALQQSDFAQQDDETEAPPEKSAGYVKPNERQPR